MKPRYSKAEEFEPYFTWKGKCLPWKKQRKMFVELGKNKKFTNLKSHDGGFINYDGKTVEVGGFPKKIARKFENLAKRIDKMGALCEYSDRSGGGIITVDNKAAIYGMGGAYKSHNIWCFSKRGVEIFGDLIEMNQKMIVSQVSRSLRKFGGDLDDLMQKGNLAMMRAARKFDPKRGYVFSTYAIQAIRTEFSRIGRKKVSLWDDLNLINGPDGEKGNFLDFLPNDYRNPNTDMANSEILKKLSRVITSQEERILHQYVLAEKTLGEIGEMEGMSQEWARRLKKEAIRRMRDKAIELGEPISLK